MGRNKRGSAADEVYASHFGSQYFNANPAMNREMAITRMLEKAITNIAMNRFKWEGLPESIDERFLEACIHFTGLAVYYKDPTFDVELAVRGTGTGFVNMLDNPVSFSVLGPGTTITEGGSTSAPAQFFNKTVQAYDPVRHKMKSEAEKREMCVPIWANYLRTPDVDMIRIYATRLAWIDRTLEINTKNARRTRILKGTEQVQLSLMNANRSIDAGEDVLMLTGPAQDMEWVESLDLGITPDSYEKLALLRTRVWQECMGLLGIATSNQDKKERLVAAEVSANDGQTDTIMYVNINCRQSAANIINDVFGQNITVGFRTEIEAEARRVEAMTNPALTDNDEDEDKEDGRGNVHDEA